MKTVVFPHRGQGDFSILDKPILSVQITTTVPAGKIWDYAGRLSRVLQT